LASAWRKRKGQAQSRRSVGPAAERESPDQLGQRSGRGFASLAAQIIKTRDTLFNDDAVPNAFTT
jgi:hypothetical protein